MAPKSDTADKRIFEHSLSAACYFLTHFQKLSYRKAAEILGISHEPIRERSAKFEKLFQDHESALKAPTREQQIADTFPPLPPSDSPIADLVAYHERCYYLAMACYRQFPVGQNAKALNDVVTAWANARRTLDKSLATDSGDALKVRYAKEFDFSDCENDRDRLGELAAKVDAADDSEP